MIGRHNILCFSSTDWDGAWGSRQQVMLRFARRGCRVLFVEQPAGLEHLLRYPDLRQRKVRRWREGLRPIVDNLWIVSLPPLLPGRYYWPLINRINQRLTVHFTNARMHELTNNAPFAIRHSPFADSPILWLYNPEQGPLIGQFGERLSVYHCIDEFTAGTLGRKRRTIAALETELLGRVDLVFANSTLTCENKRRLNPCTYRIPSGVDVEHFAQALDPAVPAHPAIARLPQPRIGYIGHVNERLDYAVLEHLARQRPDWSLVFVGDTYPWTSDAPPLRRLRTFSNVHFLGKYPFADVPALVKGMDVCLLPYVGDERACYRSPLKLYEYLAAGLPVVSTEHPEAQELSDVIYLASTPETFLERIAQAMAEDSPERQRQRVAVAQRHSWDSRVDEMERLIRERLYVGQGAVLPL
jgi:glycosyltransferase involved in cell wall biosynthesis